jgi:hypothetical protein
MQQGRFTGSRRSGHDDEFACVQSEVETDEHVNIFVAPAVCLADALELQYRRPERRHSRRISRAMAASSRKASRRGG